jgi:hypothetical protein
MLRSSFVALRPRFRGRELAGGGAAGVQRGLVDDTLTFA